MEIKLIALDLDGTTLGKGAVLTDETKYTLEAAIERGVHVVIATGRTFSAVPEKVFAIKGLEYMINSNGAHVTRLKDKKIIYSNCPDGKAVEEIELFLRQHSRYPIEVFTQGQAYIDRKVYEDVRDNGSDYLDAGYIVGTRIPVDDIYGFLHEHRSQIENINVQFRDLDDKAAMKEKLSGFKEITVTTSTTHNLEIGGRATSKADAIANLCKLLSISEENVMAVGDSPNDGAMIEAAGLGVAVANALDEVKEKADYITLSNNDNGVAYAIKKFVLEKTDTI